MQFDINERANQNMAATKHKWEVRIIYSREILENPILYVLLLRRRIFKSRFRSE